MHKVIAYSLDVVETGTINAMMENPVSIVEIPIKDIKMKKKPFASGGFGEVYKAEWRGKNVVVKVIEVDSEDEKQEVKRNANSTVRLYHGNVIKLYGITVVKRRQLGIVMDEAEHGSLDVWIGKMDHDKLTKIALGIVCGLKCVHSHKMEHKNIKPTNILMFGPKDDMIPKITDFGVWATTQVGEGGDLYVAPEARMTFKYESPADVYSLAMMLFEMFNGKLVRESSDEVKHFIMDVHRGIISKIPENFKVPVYLRNVIERGFNENPEKRPELHEYRTVLSS